MRGDAIDAAAETPVQTQKTASTGETGKTFEKTIAGMDEQRRGEFQKAQEIARKFGAEVDVSNIENGAAGVYQAGKITLNPNTKNPVRQVLVHELTHHMETSGMYGQFSDRILNYVAEDMGLDVDSLKESIRNEYAAGGIALDDAGAQRELVAKFCEDELFTSEAAINSLAQTDRNLFQKIYDWIRDTVRKIGGENSFLVDAERMYKKALESVGQVQGSDAAQYKIADINGQNRRYGRGVLLDTKVFDGVSPRNWGRALGNFVYHNLAGSELTMYDDAGNAETVYIAKANDRVRKDGAKNSHKVIDELARYRGDNVRALATVHLSEALKTSGNESRTDDHNHQWMDEKGWIHRTAYLQDRAGNIYEATLNIADGRDRKILYDISNIRKIDIKNEAADGAVPSTETGRGSHINSNFNESITDSSTKSNSQFSEKENSYGRGFRELAEEQKSGKSRYEELQLPKPGENVLNNRTQNTEQATPKTAADLQLPTPEAYAKQKNGTKQTAAETAAERQAALDEVFAGETLAEETARREAEEAEYRKQQGNLITANRKNQELPPCNLP